MHEFDLSVGLREKLLSGTESLLINDRHRDALLPDGVTPTERQVLAEAYPVIGH